MLACMSESCANETILSGLEAEPGRSSSLLTCRAGGMLPHRARNEKILAEELARMGIYNHLPLALHTTAVPALTESPEAWFRCSGYVFFNGTEDQRYMALRTNRIANVLNVVNQEQLLAELRQVHRLLEERGDFAVIPRIQAGSWDGLSPDRWWVGRSGDPLQ